MYIGLVIGILGVTVVLLVVTIVVMMRRNKQKIFNKNSMYVLITCFHESWIFYLKLFLVKKKSLFYTNNSYIGIS